MTKKKLKMNEICNRKKNKPPHNDTFNKRYGNSSNPDLLKIILNDKNITHKYLNLYLKSTQIIKKLILNLNLC